MDNIKRVTVSIYERSSAYLGYCTDTFAFTADRVKYDENPKEKSEYIEGTRWSRASKKIEDYDAKFAWIKDFAMNHEDDYDVNDIRYRYFDITVKDFDNKVLKRYSIKTLSEEGKALYDAILSIAEQVEDQNAMNFFFAASTECGVWQ